MDSLNWTFLKLMSEHRMRDVQTEYNSLHAPPDPDRPRPHPRVRGAVASALVRAGLRLDPAVGERLAPRALVSAGGRKA